MSIRLHKVQSTTNLEVPAVVRWAAVIKYELEIRCFQTAHQCIYSLESSATINNNIIIYK